MVTRDLPCTVALLMLAAGFVSSQDGEPARMFLISTFQMTSAEMGRIDSGQVVARSIATADPREVATLGVVRVRATPEFYARQLADIVAFKRSAAVLQIGRFGSMPDITDVAGLTLDEWDVRKLRECRVGTCGVQLSADAIERFRTDVDWRRGDASVQASGVMQDILVEYATRYRAMGSGVSLNDGDARAPVDSGQEFVALLDSDVDIWQHLGELRRHLLEFPNAQPARTTDILYWSKERASRRTVVSVTHMAINRPTEGPAQYAIASKQIYATHYFDASLGLTLLLRDQAAASPAMYVVYVNRSRADLFGGMFGGIARKVVSTRARALVAEQLERVQQSIEQQFAGARP